MLTAQQRIIFRLPPPPQVVGVHPRERGAQLGVLRGGAAELLLGRLRTEGGGRELLERLVGVRVRVRVSYCG